MSSKRIRLGLGTEAPIFKDLFGRAVRRTSKVNNKMEIKSRYEVIAELEERKRKLILEKDGLKDRLKGMKKNLRDAEREIEDDKEDIKDFENSMKDREKTIEELIRSVDDSLKRLSGSEKKK